MQVTVAGDFNKALRKFKKLVQNDGILREYRDRQEYLKPSVKKRRAKAEGKMRARKRQQQSQDY